MRRRAEVQNQADIGIWNQSRSALPMNLRRHSGCIFSCHSEKGGILGQCRPVHVDIH